MPAYVPSAMLVAFEAAAAIVYLCVLPRFQKSSASLIVCHRCARLHARGEAFGSAADAVAVGAFAYLLTLPFVTAGYERALSPGELLLASSTVVAGLGIVAEADYLVRAIAARVWPRLLWSAPPARVLGGGARWFGAVVAMYVFKAAYSTVGIGTLFGSAGRHLVADLPGTWTISAAAVLLAGALLASLVSRWLVPLIFHSLPTTLAVRSRPQETSA